MPVALLLNGLHDLTVALAPCGPLLNHIPHPSTAHGSDDMPHWEGGKGEEGREGERRGGKGKGGERGGRGGEGRGRKRGKGRGRRGKGKRGEGGERRGEGKEREGIGREGRGGEGREGEGRSQSHTHNILKISNGQVRNDISHRAVALNSH